MSAVAVGERATFAQRERGLGRQALLRFVRQPVGVAAFVVVAGIFVAGACASLLEPNAWELVNLAAVHKPPSLSHPFGTDAIGRDVLALTLYGVRTTEQVALISTVVATLVGTLLGALAGYYGGWLDAVVMRLSDTVTAFPAILVTLAAIVYFGTPTEHVFILVFCAYMWAVVVRVVRADVASLRTHEYVEAARAMGASDLRTLRRHILPNVGGTIAVAATSLIGQIVLVDATVDFFGYGMTGAAKPSLGNLVADFVSFKFARPNDPAVGGYGWWSWVLPCVVLGVILVGVNLIGDSLDAALNPAARRR
ncbi:MAG TPA: ABC transporter permease [Gaiellaceae bacterium]|nr:ABC transporter permease [Gaiellaceae bacterium]